MIIQNSTLQSSASRQYHFTQSIYKERSEWDNATGEAVTETTSEVTHVNVTTASSNGTVQDLLPPSYETTCNENVVGEGTDDETDETSGKSTTQKEMESLLERFKASHSFRMTRLEERAKEIQKIQRESINYLLELLLGKNEKNPTKALKSIDRTNTAGELSLNNPVTVAAEEMGQLLGKGGSYKSFYYSAERETTCFETTGTVVTADGRELSFNISLEMSRSFTAMASEQVDFGQPRFCDPLVINLNTNVASISDQKFFFDLDADGSKEEISRLGKDSGYLSLDKNNDGIINDGSELFGTSSGNGFYDLLQYDDDGNGWIDEADAIFDMLRIWSMDEYGNSTLVGLGEAKVGAIYLGYEDTEFSLNNAQNKTNAVIRKTGIFLYEEGFSGTVQQMDLAV